MGSDNTRRQVPNHDIIVVPNRFSEPTDLECFGHARSGITDLFWTIAREGEEPLVTNDEISDSRYMITLGDNFITLRIEHSVEPFRGIVRCNSGRVKQEITAFIRPSKSNYSYTKLSIFFSFPHITTS